MFFSNKRNSQLDLMRAVAIVSIVWGHNFQPPFVFFPAFFYAVPLFFFISGYFFTVQKTISDKTHFFVRKAKRLLIPYFIFNLIFGVLTSYLSLLDINLGESLNLHTLFVMPFLGAGQFHLYIAAWFLLNLFVVSIAASLIYTKDKKATFIILSLSLIISVVLLELSQGQHNPSWRIFATRSAVGFLFYSAGYAVKLYEKNLRSVLIKPITMFILYLIVVLSDEIFGNISYTLYEGRVATSIAFIPLITSISIIFIIYALTYYATKVLPKKSFLYEIGKHSFAIMVWHLTFFFLVNVMFVAVGVVDYASLSNVYFRYEPQKWWFIYHIPAIVLPVVFAKHFNKHIKIPKLKVLQTK